MQSIPMSYRDFRVNMLAEIVGEEEFGQEAIILDAIYPELKTDSERVECLERAVSYL